MSHDNAVVGVKEGGCFLKNGKTMTPRRLFGNGMANKVQWALFLDGTLFHASPPLVGFGDGRIKIGLASSPHQVFHGLRDASAFRKNFHHFLSLFKLLYQQIDLLYRHSSAGSNTTFSDALMISGFRLRLVSWN